MPSTQNDTKLLQQPEELSAAIKPYEDTAQEETEQAMCQSSLFGLNVCDH